jgi:hypothetical protein
MIHYVIIALPFLIAGMAEGFMDALIFHYWKVEGKIKLNKQFWDYTISYLNKYKDRDFSKGESFRGKWFVFTCDGFHLMKWIRNVFIFAGVASCLVFLPNFSQWWECALIGVGTWTVNRGGFNIVWRAFP